MDACLIQRFAADCPSRVLFDQIADKWSMMVLTVLDEAPQRFNAVKRRLEGVTQKALTQCLRRLERNGLVARRVIAAAPQWLAPGGALLFETSEEQAPSAVAAVSTAGLSPRLVTDDDVGATVVVGTLR